MLLKKLIVAEDDDATAHLVAAMLGDAGYLCLRARDGEQAVTMARVEQPDALVLDLMMPGMDGLEVVQRLKGDVMLSRIPIMMLTGKREVEDRVRGLDAGADDYLGKPFDPRELAARVAALVRQSRRERDRNPTTNLPSGNAIDEEVSRRWKAKEAFSLLYVDLDGYEVFVREHGFRKAEEIVRAFGLVLLEVARAHADPPPFVGHVGGDDFVMLCDPGEREKLMKRLKETFLERTAKLVSSATGRKLEASVAVVGSDEVPGGDLDALAAKLAVIKRQE